MRIEIDNKYLSLATPDEKEFLHNYYVSDFNGGSAIKIGKETLIIESGEFSGGYGLPVKGCFKIPLDDIESVEMVKFIPTPWGSSQIVLNLVNNVDVSLYSYSSKTNLDQLDDAGRELAILLNCPFILGVPCSIR